MFPESRLARAWNYRSTGQVLLGRLLESGLKHLMEANLFSKSLCFKRIFYVTQV